MKAFFDCIPCLIRQSLDSVRFQTCDEVVHERLLREILRLASEMDLRQSPPVMAQRIHRRIREFTGQSDPYREVKDRFNRLGLELYPTFKDFVDGSDNPIETAVRLVIAGNVIDFGANGQLRKAQVHEAVRQALSGPLDGDVKGLSRAVSRAKSILYLTDNAGEIVFDRLLIEHLPRAKVTAVVRGCPVLNDATTVDAEVAGLTELIEVIHTGSDAPGTVLDDCSQAFRQRFDEAQLIIAKGQGNYESLSEVDKDIYFLLKAKCPVIARDIGCQVDAMVLRRSILSAAPAGKG